MRALPNEGRLSCYGDGLAGVEGLEPATPGFGDRYSTN